MPLNSQPIVANAVKRDRDARTVQEDAAREAFAAYRAALYRLRAARDVWLVACADLTLVRAEADDRPGELRDHAPIPFLPDLELVDYGEGHAWLRSECAPTHATGSRGTWRL